MNKINLFFMCDMLKNMVGGKLQSWLNMKTF